MNKLRPLVLRERAFTVHHLPGPIYPRLTVSCVKCLTANLNGGNAKCANVDPSVSGVQDFDEAGAPTVISLEGLLWQHPGTAQVCASNVM